MDIKLYEEKYKFQRKLLGLLFVVDNDKERYQLIYELNQLIQLIITEKDLTHFELRIDVTNIIV